MEHPHDLFGDLEQASAGNDLGRIAECPARICPCPPFEAAARLRMRAGARDPAGGQSHRHHRCLQPPRGLCPTAARLCPCLVPFLSLALTGVATLARADEATEARIEALKPELEAYIAAGMKNFDLPGLAIGIVTGDRLVYAKGFGVAARAASRWTPRRSSRSARPPRPSSPPPWRSPSTKENLAWDDRVSDLDPDSSSRTPG